MTKITLSSTDIGKIVSASEWCSSNFTEKNWTLETHWPDKFYSFHFKNSKDAALFSLKWSG